MVKNPPTSAEDTGLIPGPGRSPGEGDSNQFQYSCLENLMDRGAWWAAVHGVAQSWTRLSDFTFTFHFHALEKEMATHSSVLAWRISGTREPSGLPSMESHRVGHYWSDLSAAEEEHFLIPYTKINSKWIKDLNVRPETIKLLEENIGKTLSDINYSRILYDSSPRILEIKAKINKWDLIKI